MRYNAFISYRHTPLDMEIAKKVHTGLETYHIPGAVKKKLGIKKIDRVFRDQEELPIGSSLTDNITEALKESEYLIVICSPRTPGSEWVRKEIDTFISLHGRDRVLAVLIEGEPAESFPEALLKDENGNSVEPLAADVRGENFKERNKKFKTEILRLIAPVIGCTYDDLRQRHRERIVKRTVATVSSVALLLTLAGTAFGLYNADVARKMAALADEKALLADEKTRLADDILREYELKQENQSRFFANEALALMETGEREDAALVAIAGLPGDGNDRPYVADAEYALSRVLHAYDTGSTMAFDRTLSHDLTVYHARISDDLKYIVTQDSGYNIYIWDTDTWRLNAKITPEIDRFNYLETIGDYCIDSEGVYISHDHNVKGYDFDGNLRFTYESDAYLYNLTLDTENHIGYITSGNILIMIDLTDGHEIDTIGFPDDSIFYGDKMCKAGKYFISGFKKMGSDGVDILIYDRETNTYSLTLLSEEYPIEIWYTELNDLAVLSCNEDFVTEGVKGIKLDLIDCETGSIKWTNDIPNNIRSYFTFDAKIKSHSYENEDGAHSDLVLAIESEAYTFDEPTGKLISSIDLPGDVITLNLRSDNSIGFIGYPNGKIDTFDFADGRIYSDNTIDTGLPIREICMMNGKLAIRSAYSSSVYVMKYHRSEALTELNEFDSTPTVKANPFGSDFFLLYEFEGTDYHIYSKDGKEQFSFEADSTYPNLVGFTKDAAIVFTSDMYYIADTVTKKVTEVPFSDFGIDRNMFKSSVTDNGKYAALWDSRNYHVIDVLNKTYLYGGESDTTIGNVIVSEDGKTIYVSATDKNLYKIDIASGKETLYDNDSLREVANVYSLKYMAVSHNGKLLSMCCKDGHVRIIDTETGNVLCDADLNANVRCAVYFTGDDKCLITQGDDTKVRIMNIESGEYVTSFDANYTLSRPIYTNDGFIALNDSVGLYLLNTADYGVRAFVEDATAFFSSDRSFLITSGRTMYKASYMDYHDLIEEAKRQFPDMMLTDEKKVKYNMN